MTTLPRYLCGSFSLENLDARFRSEGLGTFTPVESTDRAPGQGQSPSLNRGHVIIKSVLFRSIIHA